MAGADPKVLDGEGKSVLDVTKNLAIWAYLKGIGAKTGAQLASGVS